MESPIFIFSLPRSGSTLLQKTLMTHKDICSVAEPWILLPQVYALKKEGQLSEYSHLTAYQGISDFTSNLPEGVKDYKQALARFIWELYEKQCRNNERYFLDKTPRYYLIIDEIAELFPDAKFIFLFRNPVHIIASLISTWGGNTLKKIHRNQIDLTLGFNLLSKGYQDFLNRSVLVNYENFVESPETEIERISKFLDIDFDSKKLDEFKEQSTKGQLGDPTGSKQYSSISTGSLAKWKNVLNSSYRKRITVNLLSKINDEAFKVQGYDKKKVIQELKNIDNKKNKYFFKDLFDFAISYFTGKFNLNLLKGEFSWVKKRFLS